MPENGVLAGEDAIHVEQYFDEMCECPGMAEVRTCVWEMDMQARTAIEQERNLEEHPEERTAQEKRAERFYNAMNNHEEAVMQAVERGHITGGVTRPSGNVEFIPLEEAAIRHKRKGSERCKSWDDRLQALGFSLGPDSDGVYCSSCGKKLPTIKYGGSSRYGTF